MEKSEGEERKRRRAKSGGRREKDDMLYALGPLLSAFGYPRCIRYLDPSNSQI